MLNTLLRLTERLTQWFAVIGGAIILVQMLWISYGVFKRYFLGQPDGVVTEATALMLFPLAFLGLAYALKENAYPTVTYAVDALKGNGKRWLMGFNLLVMVCVGVFFAYVAVQASFKSFASGSASEILRWPRYLFWIPSALALVLFAWYAFLRLWVILSGHEPDPSNMRQEP